MPAIAPFSVNDGETTPVSHTFTPEFRDANGVFHFNESDGTPIGDNTITVSLRRNGTKVKGRLLLTLPTMVEETINGVAVPNITRTAYVDVSVTFDKASTTQERANAIAIMANALADSTVILPVLRDLEGLY